MSMYILIRFNFKFFIGILVVGYILYYIILILIEEKCHKIKITKCNKIKLSRVQN